MKRASVLLIAAALLAGCGDDYNDDGASSSPPPADNSMPTTEADAPRPKPAPEKRSGTVIELDDSEFGSMLFDSKKQAIYIFENDAKDKSNCYGECAAAWPPVYTKGEPKAGKGVKQSLLGTIERRDGKRQVTYAGQPLYFYVNEDPGEVRCHNVNLNGGLWWVVGPDGKRRA
jgi:predicted lipoprotein with Yx(FWY)xxD motif